MKRGRCGAFFAILLLMIPLFSALTLRAARTPRMVRFASRGNAGSEGWHSSNARRRDGTSGYGEQRRGRPEPFENGRRSWGSDNHVEQGWKRYRTEEKPEPAYGRYEGDHVFGINSVRLALIARRREISELLVQSGMELSSKKDSKAAAEILELAKEHKIPVREFSKHDLNMVTDNKPHQGFVLRAKELSFLKLPCLDKEEIFRCVLALDEVWDPQNFGALLRTAYFLRCDKVVVCSKNSAPLSPAVSRASAGALEIMPVYSTDNLMRFLDKSKENGWQVVGTDLSAKATSVYDVPLRAPTVLVLGNEGHGIRTNILRRCTHLVRIGSEGGGQAQGETLTEGQVAVSEEQEALEMLAAGASAGGEEGGSVDSLNVSVTGAIILHHFMTSHHRGGGDMNTK